MPKQRMDCSLRKGLACSMDVHRLITESHPILNRNSSEFVKKTILGTFMFPNSSESLAGIDYKGFKLCRKVT